MFLNMLPRGCLFSFKKLGSKEMMPSNFIAQCISGSLSKLIYMGSHAQVVDTEEEYLLGDLCCHLMARL